MDAEYAHVLKYNAEPDKWESDSVTSWTITLTYPFAREITATYNHAVVTV